MKEKLLEALNRIGVPVYLQGSIADDALLPNDFITFLTIDSPSVANFDNETALTAWRYQVTNYGRNPESVADYAWKIRNVLKAAGFIPIGKGRDLLSGDPNFSGWTCDFYKLENEMEVLKK